MRPWNIPKSPYSLKIAILGIYVFCDFWSVTFLIQFLVSDFFGVNWNSVQWQRVKLIWKVCRPMLYIPSQPMYSPCTLPYAPLCFSAPHYAPLSPSKTLLSPFLLLYATLQPIYTTLCSKVNFMEMHGWSRLNRTLIFNFQSKGANFRRVGWYVPPPL